MPRPAALALVLVVAAAPSLAGPKALTFGISKPYGDAHAREVPAKLEPWLSKTLGGPVKVVVHASYEELGDALATGKVDLAWITPLAFVRAAQKNAELLPLAKAMRENGLTYRAALAVRADSGLKALADLKGKRVAWVSKDSTSGYLFPRELLRKEGHGPEGFFGAETFAGDHTAACRLVLDGKADVVATFASESAEGKPVRADGCADAGKVEDLLVVASTGNLPNEVVAASAAFDSRRENEVVGAFGNMDKTPEGQGLLKDVFRVASWGVAVEGDFAPVQELLRAAEAPPKAKGPVSPAAGKPKKARP